jgi:murein tripeptide amidase MpaA
MKNTLDACINSTIINKGIVISARVHPGESQASWIWQGLIEFLVSDHHDAVAIRRHFIVKIIPMLNPDGVIYGNYRWSLLGFDLNRRWAQPSKVYAPTIFYTKKLISIFKEERDIQLYTDIHGHSRKRNTFMYGCEYSIIDYDSRAKNALIRLFPALMAQK